MTLVCLTVSLSSFVTFTVKSQGPRVSAVTYLTHLRDGSANDKPSFFAHGEEVVAEQYSMLFLVPCQQCQELLECVEQGDRVQHSEPYRSNLSYIMLSKGYGKKQNKTVA